MSVYLFLLAAWFALGVLCAIGSWWFMETHEKELMDEIPEAQIFGCIPPPWKWGFFVLMLLFGPVVLAWALCEAIREARKEKEANDPGSPPAAVAAPAVAPQAAWMVLFGLIGVPLIACAWASACPAKPLAALLEDQARGGAFLLFLFGLAGALGRGKPFHGLREPLYFLPLYLVGQVPPFASLLVAWEGGWLLGMAGALAGAVAAAAAGWLFARWSLPESEKPPSRRVRAIAVPLAFAVLFAVYGGHNWGVVWVTPDEAWAIGVLWLGLALPGALVGRPVLGLLVMSPIVAVPLVPLAASLTAGWEGGWALGIAGAAVGAAAGAVTGGLFNRWIMPEYDRRRVRGRAARPPDAAAEPGLSGSVAERSCEAVAGRGIEPRRGGS